VSNRCSEFSLVKQSIKSGQSHELPKDARSRFIISVGVMNLGITEEFRDEWLKRFGVVSTKPDEIRKMLEES
jgi:hypothetical protein